MQSFRSHFFFWRCRRKRKSYQKENALRGFSPSAEGDQRPTALDPCRLLKKASENFPLVQPWCAGLNSCEKPKTVRNSGTKEPHRRWRHPLYHTPTPFASVFCRFPVIFFFFSLFCVPFLEKTVDKPRICVI